MRKFVIMLILLLLIGLQMPLPVRAQDASSAPVIPSIGSRARQIYRAGQRLGNRRDVFSKVGDSMTAAPQFLWQVGAGGLRLEGYGNLQPTVDFFSQTSAREGNSFVNNSLAAHNAWTTYDVLNPGNAPGDLCGGASPLVCEYQLVKPAVALIMLGSNDIMFGTTPDAFRGNLNFIMQTSIDMGVIPVLSTIPDNLSNPDFGNRVGEFNTIIISVARAYGIPLWNYWRAMQDLPNRGLDGDGLHPSKEASGEAAIFSPYLVDTYGYTRRNLTALQVLDAIRRAVLR